MRSVLRTFAHKQIGNTNLRRNLTVEEAKRLAKLETIAEKLQRGKNVQNRQLQTWLSEDEYAQLENEPPLEALQSESTVVRRAFLKRTIY